MDNNELGKDRTRFRIVCLQVSKRDVASTATSITQHWGYWDTEDEAVGVAMRKLPDLKPGFSADSFLVASPFASQEPSILNDKEN